MRYDVRRVVTSNYSEEQYALHLMSVAEEAVGKLQELPISASREFTDNFNGIAERVSEFNAKLQREKCNLIA